MSLGINCESVIIIQSRLSIDFFIIGKYRLFILLLVNIADIPTTY
jgi:hypothetical protein